MPQSLRTLLFAVTLLALPPAVKAELSRSLVGYYNFDVSGSTQPNRAAQITGSGFTNDSAALLGNATVSNVIPRAGAGSLLLDGNGDYAKIAGNPVNVNADWTVAVWFRPDTAGLGLDGTKRYQVFETSGGTFPVSYALRGDGGTAEETECEMTTQANAATGLPSGYLIPDGSTDTWHHVLITYDAAAKVMRGYLDGTPRHVIAAEGLLAYAGLHLGTYRLANDRWFKGRLDELIIWQRALTPEEIGQVHSLGAGGRALFTDSDNDGLADVWELDEFGTLGETDSGDPDKDGLTNAEEYASGTSPTKPDSDGDGLSDGAEVATHGTNPTRADTDGDGVSDSVELATTLGTNPLLADTDGDGLSDGQELTASTNPKLGDTDGDGFSDYVEFAEGTDPLERLKYPSSLPVSGLDHVIISEFMANNWNVLNDEDLDSPDWIELWNPTTNAVDLSGWHLTDDPANPLKWTFPARVLNPGGRLLVFASGKDRAPLVGNLHTNFELLSEGGYLALTNAQGMGVSVLQHYPEQRVNVAYGFFGTAAPLTAGWLANATPAAPNPSLGLVQKVADTSFSVRRGIFDAPFQVTISTATPGATIAYTVDGSAPSETNGVQVSAAAGHLPPIAQVAISTTTTLRAIAHRTGMLPTNVDTQTYVFPVDVLKQSGPPAGSETLSWGRLGPDWAMDPDVVNSADTVIKPQTDDFLAIPSVSLVLPYADVWGVTGIYPAGEGDRRRASFELLNPDGSKSAPNSNAGFQARGDLHVFGGSTAVRWKTDKLSLRFRFEDDLREKVFSDSPVRRFKTLVLDARSNHSWNHPIADQRAKSDYMRDEVTADLQNALGGYAPHSQYVHLYINGLYWGVYTLHERPDHQFAAEYLGGSSGEYSAQKHNATDVIQGPVVNGVHSRADYTALLALVNGNVAVRENYDAVRAKLDIEDFIKYMILNYIAGNWDWASHNWYATRNRKQPDGRWRFHSWDAEHTWRDLGEDFTGKDDAEGPTHIHQRLVLNAEYRLRFADAVHRHLFNGGALTTTAIQRAFEKRMLTLHEAIRGESARWGDNYDITFARTRRDWLREAARLLGYAPALPNNPETTVPASPVIPGRPSVVVGQFRARGWYPNATGTGWTAEAPEFNQHGGSVAAGFSLIISPVPGNGDGTVYFTTDGYDPRVEFTGGVAASAEQATGPIALVQSAQIKARVLRSGQWSPITAAFFTLDTVPATAETLVVSELMYHPVAPSAAEAAAGFGDANDFEYIEILNAGTKALDLSNVAITAGVTFRFADLTPLARLLQPRERIVIAENPEAFRMRYGTGARVVGPFLGNLSNSGERLTITGTSGSIIADFVYADEEPWPTAADGPGYSLVLNNPFQVPSVNVASNWRASASIGGAPGITDHAPLPVNPMADDNGDGISNLIAYATGDTPTVHVGVAKLNTGSDVRDFVTFSYRRSRSADSITLIPETSSDLARWSTEGLVYLSTAWHNDGTATVTWRSAEAIADPRQATFARLKVQIVGP